LDALGIPRSWVNNRGFSKSELKAIHRGEDIPDVNRDYQGFIDFKNRYFPNTTPIIPNGIIEPPPQSQELSPQGVFDPNAPGVCSGWTTRLWVGSEARITNKGGDLKLRTGPSISASVITKMPVGYKFVVIGGPKCVDGYTWWNIQGSMGTGWSVEVADKYWWIAPMRDYVPPEPAPVPTKKSPSAEEISPEQTVLPEVAKPSKTYYEKTGSEISTCEGQIGEQHYTWYQSAWIWIVQKFSAKPVVAADRFREGQCTWHVTKEREDATEWLPSSGADAHTWDDWAIHEDQGALWGIHVDHKPQAGDIAVWEKSCGGGYSTYGHVAYVTGVRGNIVVVNEANRNGNGKVYYGSEYEIMPYSCMKFLHRPTVFEIKP